MYCFQMLVVIMTPKDIFELRKLGRIEEAYESARMLYLNDKSPYASSAMFWTAVDMLTMKANEDSLDYAKQIYLALEQLLTIVKDEKGLMHEALKRCHDLLKQREVRKGIEENGPAHLQLGAWGELLAAAYLREKGYVIIERDWHSKHRDIDIVAKDGDCLVFVEVKTRRNKDFMDPLRAVDHQKLKNLRKAMNHYIKYHRIELQCRLDVITVVGTLNAEEKPEINHVKGFNIYDYNT